MGTRIDTSSFEKYFFPTTKVCLKLHEGDLLGTWRIHLLSTHLELELSVQHVEVGEQMSLNSELHFHAHLQIPRPRQ